MKYFLTLLLIAIAPVKALADGKLIEAPVAPSFDIKDLEQRSEKNKEVKSGWSEHQAKMDEAFEKTVSFMAAESEVDIAIAAGERFLQAFGAKNNPYSEKDEKQSSEITILIAKIRSSVARGSELVEQDQSGDKVRQEVRRQEKIMSTGDPDGSFNADDWSEVFNFMLMISDDESSDVQAAFFWEVNSAFSVSSTDIVVMPTLETVDTKMKYVPDLKRINRKWSTREIKDGVLVVSSYSGVAKSFDDLGQKIWEVSLLKGELNGPVRRWHSNGVLAFEGKYKNGLQSGEFLEWHDNGAKRSSTFYKDGYPHKKHFVWRKSGEISSVTSLCCKGVPNGKSKKWHENGTLAFEGTFRKGWPISATSFFDRGTLSGKYSFQWGETSSGCSLENVPKWAWNGKGLRVGWGHGGLGSHTLMGLCKSPYFLTGTIRKYGSMWREDGSLKWEAGRGLFRFWDDNGALLFDLKNGQDRHFYSSGSLKAEINYTRNLKNLHGDFRAYWKNGEINYSGRFSRGSRVGRWKKFGSDGTLIKQACFAKKLPEREVVCS